MPVPLLPLFPLSLVLLPGSKLPLHIFEERYREMMGILIPEHGEFGVILVKDGGLVNVGCTATVEQVERRYPDGRLDIIVYARRRFQIVSLDEEKSYLQGNVDYFNDRDADPVPPKLQQRAIAEYRKLRAAADPDAAVEPRLDEPQLSFQLAQLVENLDFRQTLLAMRSESDRLLYLIENLPSYIERLEQVTLARRVAPRNGHAKHYKGEA